MKKEIHKYPFNAITEDETKIFLFDQVYEQVVSYTYRNGQIFWTITDKITSKKKEIALSAAFIFVTLFEMLMEAQSMGIPTRFPSAAEFHRPAPQHFRQHALRVNPRLDKIRFIASHKMIPVLYMDRCHGYGYINQKLLKSVVVVGLMYLQA